ncbi:MAG: ABC transporter permease [Bradymonadales bacterium]|nr:ABC transporter permease [Bradymonadales bacterium]
MSEMARVTIPTHRAPPRPARIASVWFRHYRVYFNSFFANATPAVFEPIFFIVAMGIGVGRFIDVQFLGLDYASFMAPGILAMTSMYTSSFEATYGTFVRLRYQNTYDAMLATPLTARDIFVGELLWCSTKGLLFATIVGMVLLAFGKVLTPWSILIPLVGFLTAMAFGGLSFLVTSIVLNMNHFQFYFTLILTPLIFFSGLAFPVHTLPRSLSYVAYSLPMFHVIETFRMVTSGYRHVTVSWAWVCPLLLVLMALVLGWLGVRRMARRVQR